MKSNRLISLFALLMALSLLAQPVLSGENPWDGDTSPSGSGGVGGTGNGGDGGNGPGGATRSLTGTRPHTTPQASNTEIYIQGMVFRIVTSMYSYVGSFGKSTRGNEMVIRSGDNQRSGQ